ncbi:MAG: winged helix-turn-helix domain-containing protein, partial [Parvibaculaceae bacterium]
GRFTARVCLKADRPSSVLRVNSAHGEEGRQLGETAEALMPELRELALWLGLERVVVTERGDLAKPLRQAA